MFLKLIPYWFKMQVTKAIQSMHVQYFNHEGIEETIKEYWHKYRQLKKEIKCPSTVDSRAMVRLVAISMPTALYNKLYCRGAYKCDFRRS
ncbi:MAG: hypothetical protein CL840_18725 [Crocinitomicaceae bacterium]|nr:hypothetical protein [Crocinitomicaceae bacterium]